MNPTTQNSPSPEWLPLVEAQVATLQFGSIQIVVHDSKVVQIEIAEKFRVEKPRRESAR